MTAPPKAVVMDIGNVLFNWDPAAFFDGAIGPDRRRALFGAVDLQAMNAAIDLGAPFAETVRATARANPGWEGEIMLWHDRWPDMAVPAIAQSRHLFQCLRARGVAVFALSNFGAEPFELAASTLYPFLRDFDRTYISGSLGLAKPDPAIYRLVEKDSGIAPADLLFTDDRPENVEAANTRGWRTHLFREPQGWAARLIAEGLLTQEDAA